VADSKRKEWNMDSVRSSVLAVKDKEMGFLKAAKTSTFRGLPYWTM
jgi:hypothetical protein